MQKGIFKVILFYISGIFILMSYALYNKYPFIYSDTGTYLVSAMTWEVPWDRPIFYGIFAKTGEILNSLWVVVILQSWIGVFLIYKNTKNFLGLPYLKANTLLFLMVLSYFTGFGWLCGELIPDIFSAYLFLSLMLILHEKTDQKDRLFSGFIFLISMLVHLGNLFLGAGLIALIFLCRRWGKELGFTHKGLIAATILLLASPLLMMIVNGNISGQYSISNGSPAFMMGSMCESGILKRTLDKHCGKKSWDMCRFREEVPSRASDFLWSENGLMAKTNGPVKGAKEYREIILASITDPELFGLHIQWLVKATITQLFQLRTGAGMSPYGRDAPAFWPVEWKYKNEVNSFLNSKQAKAELDLKDLTNRQTWILLLSIGFLSYLFFRNRDIPFGIILFLLFFLAENACITSVLSTVDDRLQARVIWLLPLFAFWYFVRFFRAHLNPVKKN